MQTDTIAHCVPMHVWAHHLLAAGYNEMKTISASTEMVWLSGCPPLALTQSQAPEAPASPPSLCNCLAQKGGPSLGWRVELETLLWASFTDRLWAMPNPTTWAWLRTQQCEDGTHNTLCDKRSQNFVDNPNHAKDYHITLNNKHVPSPQTMSGHMHHHGNTGMDKQLQLEIVSI